MNDWKKIEKAADDKSIILFDIFDTLMHRKVSPEYTKKMWCGYLSRTYLTHISPIDVYKYRNKLELELCNENFAQGNSNEFSYSTLLKNMYKHYQEYLEVSEAEFTDFCERIELEIENDVLYVDENVLNILQVFKRKGKKMYCISDIYYSQKNIKKLLDSKGLLKYFNDVYVSCKYFKTKSDGKLYNLVLKELKINCSDCLMIGDNPYSDFEMAKKNGIDSCLLNMDNYKNQYHTFEEEYEPNKVLLKFNELCNQESKYNFDKLTYSLYLFTEKLYYSLIKDNVKNVFFFAREGQFLKKIFDYFQEENYGPKIKTHYLCVSRIATFLPSLKELNVEKFDNLLKQYAKLSIRKFLENLTFNDKEIEEIKNKTDFNLEKEYENFKNSKQFKLLKKNKIFSKIYNEKRKNAKKMFLDYLKQFNVNLSNGMFVVDVGWKGTIQNNIQAIMPDVNVKGYYLGIVHYEKIKDYDKKKAILFEISPKKYSKNSTLYNTNRSLFEILLAADHGSTLTYERTDVVNPVFCYQEKESELFKNNIKPIQIHIFNLFKEISTCLKINYYDTVKVEKLINSKHFELVFSPTKNELNQYNSFYHFENFGPMNYTNFSNEKLENSFITKIKNYKNFIKIARNDGTWQCLKLYNKDMKFGMKILRFYKKLRCKKNKIIK